jgi:uncharacterized protein
MEETISNELLKILCCPETHQGLSLVQDSNIEKLNELQSCGKLTHRNGKAVNYRLSGALLREDGKVLYPIREGFPVMLIEESISGEILEN